jgi:hypothetical protein
MSARFRLAIVTLLASAFGATAVAPSVALADLLPPETTITSGPSGLSPTARNTFEFMSSEPGSTFECKVDRDPWTSCESPYRTDSLTQGTHTFSVRATDVDGNTDPTPASATWVIDRSITGANAAARRSVHVGKRTFAIVVTVRASEAATVKAGGTVRTGKHEARLTGSTVTIPPEGGTATIRVVPNTARDARRVRKEIKRRGKAMADLHATFQDSLGNRAKSGSILVKLK